MNIKWLGRSEIWKPIESERLFRPTYLFPLAEEDVLLTAELIRKEGFSGLSMQAAINCSSRLALRISLEQTAYNPPWQPFYFPYANCVIKAPASTHSNGVRFINTENRTILKRYAPGLANYGVVEQFQKGPQYEVDGVVFGGIFHFFTPLLQKWNDDYTQIQEYEPVTYNWAIRNNIYHDAERIVEALGLNYCPFCIELRLTNKGFICIEAHARLGEDPGFPDLLQVEGAKNESPLTRIERVCDSGEWALPNEEGEK